MCVDVFVVMCVDTCVAMTLRDPSELLDETSSIHMSIHMSIRIFMHMSIHKSIHAGSVVSTRQRSTIRA